MRSLLWKEWHEQSWKLAFSCILLGAMAAIGLHSRIISDSDTMIWVCLVGMALPISYSSGLLPAERDDGYFESLIALPVTPWKILLATTFMGLVLCIVPFGLALGVTLLTAGDREMSDLAVIALYVRSIFAAVILFVWMMTLTSQLPNETRAGLLSVALLAGWLMLGFGLIAFRDQKFAPTLTPIAFALDVQKPNGREGAPEYLPDYWPAAVAIQLAMAAALWLWASRRFAGCEEGRR
jgi:ABC-type transport system involved in multi-copper enzyme maturation permease subunit